MKTEIKSLYGENPLESKDLAKIININHFDRLNSLVKEARINEQIVFGGDSNKEYMKISPTLVIVRDRDDPLMREEIFGPIMPIIEIENLEKALVGIRKCAHPLALYMFGGTKNEQEKVIESTISGGLCINDVVLQAGIPELPFGGVGRSGIGKYHGKYGFETFSHLKSILRKPFWLDNKFRYPPYKMSLSLLKKLLN